MKKEFIVYKGDIFTIEWYFSSRGKSDVLEYLKNYRPIDRKKRSIYLDC